MMCTTVLYGGECHRTSTPHKSGNKMQEKMKFFKTRLYTALQNWQIHAKLAVRFWMLVIILSKYLFNAAISMQ